jgi:hypothetical protein
MIPFPVPDEVTTHQVWLLTAVQEQPVVTAKFDVPEEDATSLFDGVTASVQFDCGTITCATGDTQMLSNSLDSVIRFI